MSEAAAEIYDRGARVAAQFDRSALELQLSHRRCTLGLVARDCVNLALDAVADGIGTAAQGFVLGRIGHPAPGRVVHGVLRSGRAQAV